jgi:hypothetical protein
MILQYYKNNFESCLTIFKDEGGVPFSGIDLKKEHHDDEGKLSGGGICRDNDRFC